ncbi:hypothetical protein IDJ77_06655 [Mucilaginibacter sp. ZT4R22]|uniref:Uncharacterized protein n=1 Tax=Mucilaginibacter pankratovii TaxID=2772110 RepID=A0ABR7WQ77_9SPHI|nr:hypothetical protein [Mucilaginibacter pankratovii]MBD1363484.1 hypothetical protein [Mucilaginibacter pankratovii]
MNIVKSLYLRANWLTKSLSVVSLLVLTNTLLLYVLVCLPFPDALRHPFWSFAAMLLIPYPPVYFVLVAIYNRVFRFIGLKGNVNLKVLFAAIAAIFCAGMFISRQKVHSPYVQAIIFVCYFLPALMASAIEFALFPIRLKRPAKSPS